MSFGDDMSRDFIVLRTCPVISFRETQRCLANALRIPSTGREARNASQPADSADKPGGKQACPGLAPDPQRISKISIICINLLKEEV